MEENLAPFSLPKIVQSPGLGIYRGMQDFLHPQEESHSENLAQKATSLPQQPPAKLLKIHLQAVWEVPAQ